MEDKASVVTTLEPSAICGSTTLEAWYYQATVIPAVNRGITVLPDKTGAEMKMQMILDSIIQVNIFRIIMHEIDNRNSNEYSFYKNREFLERF